MIEPVWAALGGPFGMEIDAHGPLRIGAVCIPDAFAGSTSLSSFSAQALMSPDLNAGGFEDLLEGTKRRLLHARSLAEMIASTRCHRLRVTHGQRELDCRQSRSACRPLGCHGVGGRVNVELGDVGIEVRFRLFEKIADQPAPERL